MHRSLCRSLIAAFIALQGCDRSAPKVPAESPPKVSGEVFRQDQDGTVRPAAGREVNIIQPDSAAVTEARAMCKKYDEVIDQMLQQALGAKPRTLKIPFEDANNLIESQAILEVNGAMLSAQIVAGTTTDSRGQFTFDNVPVGHYLIVVRQQSEPRDLVWAAGLASSQRSQRVVLGPDAEGRSALCRELLMFSLTM